MEKDAARDLLTELFEAALEAVRAERRLPPVWRELLENEADEAATGPARATILIAYGKAAGPMARAALDLIDPPVRGLVVAPYGYLAGFLTDVSDDIETIEAGHPVPDAASERAALRALALARSATADERAVFLASGGGSAAMAAPRPPLTLAAKREIVRHLVLSGAPIEEINLARRHLSAVKGGRLARAASAAARHWTLATSDVVSDDPALIASGPSIPMREDPQAASAILERWDAPHVPLWRAALAEGETSCEGNVLPPSDVRVIARGADALAAASARATRDGWQVHDLGAAVTGEADEVARRHADLVRRLHRTGGRHLIVSGGELTVRIGTAPHGEGGPNLEYLAALMIALDGLEGVHALAADTDGRDGSGGQAGGWIHPDSLKRARMLGFDPAASLARHETRALFSALGDLLEPGPIPINVNDFRAILIAP
ncbi:MAG: DUF4147 domain-containing protein [Alphaproteobacteria bacterium]|nr:MAG: DUF4147 domain-containing protein [Alphaproteobacteria bacterium]